MGALLGIVLFVAIGVVLTYAHSHRADGKPSAVWDCQRDDCKYRNKAMHRHPVASL